MSTVLNMSLTAAERDAIVAIAGDLMGFSNIPGGERMQPVAIAAARGAIRSIAQEVAQ